MKTLVLALVGAGSLLAGCVAVEPVGYSSYGYGTTYYDSTYSSNRGFRDRDHDGVPNRYDRRPDNPYRY